MSFKHPTLLTGLMSLRKQPCRTYAVNKGDFMIAFDAVSSSQQPYRICPVFIDAVEVCKLVYIGRYVNVPYVLATASLRGCPRMFCVAKF